MRVTVGIGPQAQRGHLDPYTGNFTPAPFQASVLWAGPSWRPKNGLRFDAFGQGVTETPRRVESIGGQVYAMPQPRRRTLSAEFTLLSEDEVYTRREMRSALHSKPTLQQLAAWCVVSRPLVVLPIADDAKLVYAQGIYGYLDSPMSWALVTRANTGDGSQRQYRTSLQMTEAL